MTADHYEPSVKCKNCKLYNEQLKRCSLELKSTTAEKYIPNTQTCCGVDKIKVRAYTLKEAEEIMKFCLRHGYEGVQNDSYRYCKTAAWYALKRGRCYICVSYRFPANIVVCDTHWRKHRKYKELSKSKFEEILKSRKK